MSQAAALFVVASAYADSSDTHGARHYYLGMRDAFEAVMRGCHSVPGDVNSMVYATGLLSNMDETARNEVLRDCKQILRARRRESIAGWTAVI